MATGMCFLETAANPYVTALGTHDTASRRLNLAQSFNRSWCFHLRNVSEQAYTYRTELYARNAACRLPGGGKDYPDGDRLREDALSGSCRVTHHSCSSVYTV